MEPEDIIEIEEDGKVHGNDLEQALTSALNRFSAENASNTPDWVLAQFLLGCLAAWNQGVGQRETWYGRDGPPCAKGGPSPASLKLQQIDALTRSAGRNDTLDT